MSSTLADSTDTYTTSSGAWAVTATVNKPRASSYAATVPAPGPCTSRPACMADAPPTMGLPKLRVAWAVPPQVKTRGPAAESAGAGAEASVERVRVPPTPAMPGAATRAAREGAGATAICPAKPGGTAIVKEAELGPREARERTTSAWGEEVSVARAGHAARAWAWAAAVRGRAKVICRTMPVGSTCTGLDPTAAQGRTAVNCPAEEGAMACVGSRGVEGRPKGCGRHVYTEVDAVIGCDAWAPAVTHGHRQRMVACLISMTAATLPRAASLQEGQTRLARVAAHGVAMSGVGVETGVAAGVGVEAAVEGDGVGPCRVAGGGGKVAEGRHVGAAGEGALVMMRRAGAGEEAAGVGAVTAGVMAAAGEVGMVAGSGEGKGAGGAAGEGVVAVGAMGGVGTVGGKAEGMGAGRGAGAGAGAERSRKGAREGGGGSPRRQRGAGAGAEWSLRRRAWQAGRPPSGWATCLGLPCRPGQAVLGRRGTRGE